MRQAGVIVVASGVVKVGVACVGEELKEQGTFSHQLPGVHDRAKSWHQELMIS